MIAINDAYLPYLDNRSRYLVFFGGAGSGKSVFAGQKLIHRITTEEKTRILAVRKYAVTLRESVFKLLREEISSRGILHEFQINKTDKTFTHTPTGNEIICVGLDDPEKLKSIVGITSVWVEEPTELTEEDFDQLDLRLRGETQNYKQILLTFNPIDERHWIKKRFFDSNIDSCTTLHTTYQDNYFIDEEYKSVLEQKAAVNPNYYRIYKLGEWGKADVQRPFIHNFDRSRHVSDSAIFNPHLPVRVILDFNLQPFVCLMNHTWQDTKGIHKHWFKEIVIDNGDFTEMARRIKECLPPIILSNAIFSGDATGQNKRLDTRPGVSSWRILSELLNISPARLKLRKANPSVKDMRPGINLMFGTHPDLKFHPSMSLTINELQYTEADEEGNILKKDRSKMEQRADALDIVRYDYINFHSDYEKFVR